jgi:UDPglucose 6-dehydrogenase
MRIGIVGGGTVGRATARCYMEWADVMVYDRAAELSTHTFSQAVSADIIFLCLPTPEGPHSLLAVEQVCEELRGSTRPIALRSTVPVGTTTLMRLKYDLTGLCHHPEFLTARCAITDAQLPARIIGAVRACDGATALHRLLLRRFGTSVPTLRMSCEASELVKLASNAFFATKVAFFNELRDVADAAGCRWDDVLAGLLSDGRIAHSHTQVPGPDGLYGFGGACLPKDAWCFAQSAERLGASAPLVEAALDRNRRDRLKGAS